MRWVGVGGIQVFLDASWYKRVDADYGVYIHLLPCVGAGGRPGFALVEEGFGEAYIWREWYDTPEDPGGLDDVPGIEARDVREIMEAVRRGLAGLKAIDGVTIHGDEVWRSVVDLSAPQWVYIFLHPCVGRDGRPGFALTEYGAGPERVIREWYDRPGEPSDLAGVPGLDAGDVREIIEALEIGLG